MKWRIYLSILVVFSGLSAGLFAQNYQLSVESDLPVVLHEIEKDSLLHIERKASLEFHKLLNEYRKNNELDALDWNETFWLTCRNHNFYMSYNDVLSHSETGTEKHFSGEGPGDRLKYVQGNNKTLSWSGENALYNYSSNGYNVENMAQNIAQASFEQWKNSRGHNQNMLSKAHKFHGASFIITDSKVYATSLFGYPTSDFWADYVNNEISNPETKAKTTISYKPERVKKSARINLLQAHKNLEKKFLTDIFGAENKQSVKQEKALKLCARKQVYYMANNNQLDHIQKRILRSFYGKNVGQRIAKAEGKSLWFLNRKTDVTEYILLIETEESKYNEEILSAQLFEKMIIENNIDTDKIKDLGFYVKVKRKKSKLLIYATLLIRNIQ